MSGEWLIEASQKILAEYKMKKPKEGLKLREEVMTSESHDEAPAIETVWLGPPQILASSDGPLIAAQPRPMIAGLGALALHSPLPVYA